MNEYIKSLINPLGVVALIGLFAIIFGVVFLIVDYATWGEKYIIYKENEPVFYWFTVLSFLGFGAIVMGIPVFLCFRSVKRGKLQPAAGGDATRWRS